MPLCAWCCFFPILVFKLTFAIACHLACLAHALPRVAASEMARSFSICRCTHCWSCYVLYSKAAAVVAFPLACSASILPRVAACPKFDWPLHVSLLLLYSCSSMLGPDIFGCSKLWNSLRERFLFCFSSNSHCVCMFEIHFSVVCTVL